MIDLIDICQSYPGCPAQGGFPLLGVVAPPDASCTAYLLPFGPEASCIELGDIVPFGRLYTYPPIFPGEIVAFAFDRPN